MEVEASLIASTDVEVPYVCIGKFRGHAVHDTAICLLWACVDAVEYVDAWLIRPAAVRSLRA